MTSQENKLTGKPPHMKKTTYEDDLKEEDLRGRQLHRRRTSHEDNLTRRQPHRKTDEG